MCPSVARGGGRGVRICTPVRRAPVGVLSATRASSRPLPPWLPVPLHDPMLDSWELCATPISRLRRSLQDIPLPRPGGGLGRKGKYRGKDETSRKRKDTPAASENNTPRRHVKPRCADGAEFPCFTTLCWVHTEEGNFPRYSPLARCIQEVIPNRRCGTPPQQRLLGPGMSTCGVHSPPGALTNLLLVLSRAQTSLW